MTIWRLKTFFSLGIILLGLTLACGTTSDEPSAVSRSEGRVQIFSPAAEQRFMLGREILIQSTSVDNEGIQRVELLINQQVIRADENPEPIANAPFIISQAWKPRAPGAYIIQVRAYNISQKVWQSEPITAQIMPAVSPPMTPLATLVPVRSTATPLSGSVARDVIYTPTPVPPTPIGVRASPSSIELPPAKPAQGRLLTTPLPNANNPPPSLDGTIIVVDNSSPEFQTSGVWFLGDGGQSYNGSCAWAPRGSTNNAYWVPKLPASGSYELFAWWCGDLNHDQATEAQFYIKTADGPQTVRVNLRDDAGRWNSLGQYRFQADGREFVNMNGGYEGNVVADALKFVFVSATDLPTVVPSPTPTAVTRSNNSPPPRIQISAGDLTTRLLVTGNRFYDYTPHLSIEEVQFDSCRDFPHAECGGLLLGWQIELQHLAQSHELFATYRVSEDYQHLMLVDPSPTLKERQRVFLAAGNHKAFIQIDRYPAPDYSWHLFGEKDGLPFDQPLPDEVVLTLTPFIEKYNSVSLNASAWEGWLTLYGWGPTTAFSAEDAATLEALGQQLLSTNF